MKLKLFQRKKPANPSAAVKSNSTQIVACTADLLGLPTDVQLLVAKHLGPHDWVQVSLTCTRLRGIYNQPIVTYKETLIKKVIETRILPPEIFSDPFFKAFPINFRLLEQLLTKSAPILKMLFTVDVKPWQIAALLGMDEALHKKYGKEIVDLKDDFGLTVAHYYALGGHLLSLTNWYAGHDPQFMKRQKNEDDYTIVEVAANAGYPEILAFCKNSCGFDLTRFDEKRQRTLLHSATMYGQGQTVLWLIQEGVDPSKGQSLLLEAAFHGHWNIYKYFVSKGIKIESRSELAAVIIYAARDGRIKFIRQLAEKYNAVLSTISHEGVDVFTSSICGGKFKMVKLCCDENWGKIDRRWENNTTALHIAAGKGRVELIGALLKEYPKQLNVNMVDDFGRTPLFPAAEHGDFDAFSKLMELFNKKHYLKQDINGISIIHVAAHSGRLHFLRKLADKLVAEKLGKKCLQQLDKLKRSPLHYACCSINLSLIHWLVDTHKLSFAATDIFGKTPLHLLAEAAPETPILWENLVLIAEQYGIEYVTDYRDKTGKSVKDYLELANEPQVLSEINAMCRHQKSLK